MFRFLVLGLLRNGESQHGYALMKQYRERSGLQLSTGNFYRELQRLVGEGLVRTVSNPSGADPRRAPYVITDSGAEAFDIWLAGPSGPGFARYEDELSSRAMFVADAEPPLARKLLDGWKEELWIRTKVIERAREAALARRGTSVDPAFAGLALLLTRNLKHVVADIEFIDEFSVAYQEWTNGNRLAGDRKRKRSPAPPALGIRSAPKSPERR
jgi:DNA-binding PadR family transcriptional regulator